MIAPVNKIIPSSVVDGPGNRTAIFFQSCNFNCKYCHNPETIHMCNHCGKCVELCPAKALSIKAGKVVWNKDLCCNCDTCIKNCTHNASPRIMYMTVDEVMNQVEENIPFIRGITVSGGECTLQIDFVKKLFSKAKQLDLTCLLDSNGSYDFKSHPEIFEVCDGVMLDIKATNPEIHQWLTDVPNQRVLENALYLAQIGKLTEIRTVCIPGTLDDEDTIKTIGSLLGEYAKNTPYKLIKYRRFGVREQYRTFNEPTDEYMNHLKEIALEAGFEKIIVI